MSCGIYKIKNLINNKIYIGQSVFIEQRWAAHRYAGRNAKDNYPIHKAMNEYGIENFSFEIIEECDITELNDKEVYWIQFYDSYKNGYNATPGGTMVQGENNPRAILDEVTVFEIRQLYNNHVPFKKAFELYKDRISKRGFQKVWHYETWLHICPEVYTEENRRWHATEAKKHLGGNVDIGYNNLERACSEEEINKMKLLRAQGLSYNKIGELLNRSQSTVRKNCLHTSYKPQFGIQVKNIETGLIFNSYTEAAKWARCDKGTFARHKDDSFWPIGIVPTTQNPAHWEWL